MVQKSSRNRRWGNERKSMAGHLDCRDGALRRLSVMLLGGTMLALAGTSASADCFLSGSTISCSSPGTGGYFDPAGDNLALTVQSGATVVDSGFAAIVLRDNNVITNNGTIAAGDNAAAIYLNNDNVIRNNATITAGADGAGISGGDRNVVFNSGTISVGDGVGSYGIALGTDNAVVNSGTITVGHGGTGIALAPNTTLPATDNVINSGTINVAEFGIGINIIDNHRVLNSGNINAAGASLAMFGGSDNVVVNTGRIQGFLVFTGFNNTFTNQGTLIGGDASLAAASGAFIGGTLINDPTGTIAVRVDPTFTDNYSADNVIVNGGRLHAVIRPGLYNDTTTFSAIGGCGCGSYSGTFDIVSSSSPFFTATADYSSGTGVDVTLTRIPFGAVPGMTANQRAVGSALEPGYSTSLTGDLAAFYGNLISATSLGVLDQLSGAGTAAAQDASFAAGSQFGNAMLQQGAGWGARGGSNGSFGGYGFASAPQKKLAGKPGAEAFAAMEPRRNADIWRAWTLGFGSARATDGQAGTFDQSSTTFGGAIGIDKQITPDLSFGLAAGGSSSHFSVSALSSSGRMNAGHIGGYAVQRLGDAYLAATLTYMRGETSTERTITGVGPTETAKGRFASDQLSGRIELGRKYGFSSYSVTPFVALEPAALWQHAYSETSSTLGGGPGVLGLSYTAKTTTSLPLFLGAQLDARYTLRDGQTFAPYARLSWVHEFRPERSVTASFITIPTTAFTADGARAASDAARLEAGGTLTLSRAASLFVNVNSELSARSRSIAANGGLRTSW